MPKWLKSLGLAVAALAVAYGLTCIPWGSRGSKTPAGLPADPVKLQIETPVAGVTLERKEGLWRVAAPVIDAADEGTVQRVLTGLKRLALESPVTDAAETHGQYLLAEGQALRLSVWDAGAPAPFVVLLGKPAGLTGRTYVRLGDGPRVYLASGLLREEMNMPLARWRDRRVLPRADVVRVEVRRGKDRFTIDKSSVGWTVDGAIPDEARADAFISSLRVMSADDIVDPPAALDLKLRGMDKPAASFTVHFSSGAPVSLDLGSGDPRAVRREGSPVLYLVPAGALASLDVSRKDLLPPAK